MLRKSRHERNGRGPRLPPWVEIWICRRFEKVLIELIAIGLIGIGIAVPEGSAEYCVKDNR